MKYCEKCVAKNVYFDFFVMALQTSCGAFRQRERVTLQTSCGAFRQRERVMLQMSCGAERANEEICILIIKRKKKNNKNYYKTLITQMKPQLNNFSFGV